MNSARSEWDDFRPVGHHFVAATVAAILSISLHVGAGVYLSKIRLSVSVVTGRPDKQVVRKHMRLRDVKRFISVDNANLPPGEGALRHQHGQDADSHALALAPDLAVIQPPAVEPGLLGDGRERMPSPSDPEARTPWQARPDIMAIERKVLADNVSGLSRWTIARIERVRDTDDLIWPTETTKIPGTGNQFPAGTGGGPARASLDSRVVADPKPPDSARLRLPDLKTSRSDLFKEKPKDITSYRAIEEGLTAIVESFHGFGGKYQYFKIKIDRGQEEILPVLPKDIIFVQDCSASMAEQRLYFCRAGLTNCITLLGPADRFNIMNFRDKAELCFPDWVENNPGNIQEARAFIMAMSSKGNTDIFTSIKSLVDLDRKPGRPVVALLVTDGRSTTGVTRSSDIIGEFSKLNDGNISVFTMGTIHLANKYLLDLLSYCNRGDVRIAAGGRWGIPESMREVVAGVSRPIVSDMTCHFGRDADSEVYPVLTSNLYLDRTYTLYGRCPKGQERIIFQVRGKAGSLPCDMLFNLDLAERAVRGSKDIRIAWAEQKIYHFIGEYARSKNPAAMKAIKNTAREYKIKVPYEGAL